MTKPQIDNEYLKILHLLGLFQALEALIKVYIGLCYAVINIKVRDSIAFNYTYKDIDNHPLEKLLTIFKKLNSNNMLCDKLNALRNSRNQLAHKSILLASPSLSQELKETFLGGMDSQIDYEQLQIEVNACIKILIEEATKVRQVA